MTPSPDDLPQTPAERLDRLRRAVSDGAGPVVVAIHDCPDPDAMAAGSGLLYLISHWGIEADIWHGGFLGRPENRVMTELVGIRTRLFPPATLDAPAMDWRGYRGVVVVDTQPGARNHSIPFALVPLAVVDHHHPPPPATGMGISGRMRVKPRYEDIRLGAGCTSALVYEYLATAGLEPPKPLATALFLGVQTDTDDLLRDAGPLDKALYIAMLSLADMHVVRQVRRPLLSRGFYALLARALRRARRRGAALVTDCGAVDSPDMLSVMSDLLIQSADAEWALAVGRHQGVVYLSLRLRGAQGYGTRLLRSVVEIEGGSAGGHRRMAGGQATPADGDTERASRAMIHRFLELVDLGSEPDHPFLPPETDPEPEP